MSRGLWIAVVGVALVLLALGVGILFLERRGEAVEGLLVVLLTPGFEDEVKGLLAGDDRVYVVGAGGDPHEIQLSPSDVEVLRKADLIISMGHTAVDRRVEELRARGDIKARVLNLLEIPGLLFPELPEDHEHEHGGRNYHEPFYDPRNMVVILRRITDVLVELRPEKRSVYEGNYERLKARLDEMIKAYEGSLRGYKAIISTAEIQPAVEWLGVRVTVYVVADQHESPSPQALAKAISEMEKGGVIVFVAVRCDGTCSLASHLDRRLAEEARSRGLPVLEIPLGYTGTSIINKLEYIISQVQQLKGG
jgi:zinc/manganese transport system substrate-binding protein